MRTPLSWRSDVVLRGRWDQAAATLRVVINEDDELTQFDPDRFATNTPSP